MSADPKTQLAALYADAFRRFGHSCLWSAWAAAAKSPGLSPDGIIEALRARARFTDAHLSQERLTKRLDAAELNTWIRTTCDTWAMIQQAVKPRGDGGDHER
jgi:hypothetical protein